MTAVNYNFKTKQKNNFSERKQQQKISKMFQSKKKKKSSEREMNHEINVVVLKLDSFSNETQSATVLVQKSTQ